MADSPVFGFSMENACAKRQVLRDAQETLPYGGVAWTHAQSFCANGRSVMPAGAEIAAGSAKSP